MKKTPLILGTTTAVLLTALVWLNFGCAKKETAPKETTSTAPAKTSAAPRIVSVEKTSFAEVTSQLDPGGNFYLYLSTAQWLDHLSQKVDALRHVFTAMPGAKQKDLANINKAIDMATNVIRDSGVEDITGVGMSSVEIEKGMFHNKMLLHHYAGKGNGFLWKLCGQKPHALTGLNLLPANTAFATFSDLNVPLLWTVVKKEAAKSGFPQAQDFLNQLPKEFEKQTQVKWDDFLNSLGGEFGFVLTLDESNNIPIPVPGAALQVPEPGLLLVLKVKNETIFNRIDQELKQNPQVISTNYAGFRMRTMPVPIPFLGTLRPTAASGSGYLFIASSDKLINEAIAVRDGKAPGLKGTAEFKRLSQDIPAKGNQFAFMSERFGRILFQIQQQVVAGQMAKGHNAAQSQWLKSIMHNKPACAYSVGINTPEGCLNVGNGSESFANIALLPAVTVPAMLSAIAIPNFVKARQTAQRNACINNLRRIDAAKQQWALEKGKTTNDVPTKADLMPYLNKWPVCPAGGHYTIGAVGEPPTCSIRGHKLP